MIPAVRLIAVVGKTISNNVWRLLGVIGERYVIMTQYAEEDKEDVREHVVATHLQPLLVDLVAIFKIPIAF